MSGKATLKILLIDDEPFMLKLLSRTLATLGLTQVIMCESGREALDCLDIPSYNPDLILLDLNMPEMDGLEFVRHLTSRQYSGAIILVSGEDERMLQTAEKLVQMHKITSLGHLQKPVTPMALSSLIDNWMPPWLNEPLPALKTYNVKEIRTAISNQELINYYQPQIDVATGKLVGVEALVRWQHPQDGIVFPDQFIRIAEAYGLISDLTKFVVESAFSQLNVWQNNHSDLLISVNISMDNLTSLEFVDYLVNAAAAADITPSDVVLEVTETQLMKNLSTSQEVLTRLRLKRFGMSVDDFGTGYSSFTLLNNIPFSELKIDQGFVHGAAHNDRLRAIYSTSLNLAQQLGMKTVAEGVEDWEDWNLLRSTSCDVAQGYFIARPMPADKFLDWLASWDANIEILMASSIARK
jgi:EAL domain-containing protein (putative c-di-GMP-specific phosphodiesterase class I)/CheY-like chemotaxis protein